MTSSIAKSIARASNSAKDDDFAAYFDTQSAGPFRRFAAAAVLAEQMEGRLANGETIDIAEHAQLSSTLVRITNHLGLERVPKDITPDPLAYAREREIA